jgi:hypothetical protein
MALNLQVLLEMHRSAALLYRPPISWEAIEVLLTDKDEPEVQELLSKWKAFIEAKEALDQVVLKHAVKPHR